MQYRISTASREINKLTMDRTYVSLKDFPQSLFYLTGEIMYPVRPMETFGVEGLKTAYTSQLIVMDVDLIEIEECAEIHITYKEQGRKHDEPLPNHPITVDDRTVIWWETGGDEPPLPDDNIPTIEVPLEKKMYYWVTCTNCGITTGIAPMDRKINCPSCNVHIRITLVDKRLDEYKFMNPFLAEPVRYHKLRYAEEPDHRRIYQGGRAEEAADEAADDDLLLNVE